MNIGIRSLRYLAFVLLLGIAFFGQSRGVLAWGNPFNEALTTWTSNYPCYKEIFTVGYVWNQHLHCDFEDNEYPDDPISHGVYMGDVLWSPCIETCEEDYLEAVAYVNNEPENAWCYTGWETYSTAAGMDDSYASCSCNYWRWCWD